MKTMLAFCFRGSNRQCIDHHEPEGGQVILLSAWLSMHFSWENFCTDLKCIFCLFPCLFQGIPVLKSIFCPTVQHLLAAGSAGSDKQTEE